MATTAHEVSLGVSVETAAAVSSLESLQTKIRDIGATFSGAVSQLNGFTGSLSRLGAAVSSVSAGALGNWSSAITSIGGATSASATGIASFTTALNTLSTAVNNTNISSFRSQLALLQSTAGQMSAAASQIAPFSAAINTLGNGMRKLGNADLGINLAVQMNALQSAAPAMGALSGPLGKFGAAISAIGGGLSAISGGTARATQFNAIINALLPTLSAIAGATIPPPSIVLGMRYVLNNLGTALATLSGSGIRASAVTAFSNAISSLVNGLSVLSSAPPPSAAVVGRYSIAVNQLTAAFKALSTSGVNASTASQFSKAISSIVTALNGMGAGPNTSGVAAFSAAIRNLAASLASIPTSSVATLTAISTALRSMSTVAPGLNALPSAISRVNASLSNNDGGSRINSTASAVSILTSRLTGLVGAYFGAQAIRQFGESVMNTGADFDFAMGTVKAVSRNTADYSTAAFNAMEAEAIRMGRTTTYSASQAAEALKELTQGGLTTRQAISALSETMKLAETEQMSVADASRIVTSMMAQFQASAGELSTYVDKLAKTSAVSKTSIDQLKYALAYTGTAARSANQSFDEVISAIGALSTAGVESSQAGTTMRDMLSDLTDTTSLASRKLRSLGFGINELNPRYNSLSQIITKLRNRGVDAADAMAIFGVRGGLAAGSLITVYKQYMETLDAVKNKSKGAADQMQQDVTSNLRGDLKKLSAAWENFVITVFKSGFGDLMRGVVTSAKQAVLLASDFVDMFKTIGNVGGIEAFKTALSVTTNLAFGEAINLLVGGAVTAGEALLKSIMALADPKFWSFLFEVGKTLGLLLESAAFSLTGRLLDGSRAFVVDMLTGLLNAADNFISRITGGMQKVLRPQEYLKLSSARDQALRSRDTQVALAQADMKANPSPENIETWGEVIKNQEAALQDAQRAVDAFLGNIPTNSEANRKNAEAMFTGMTNDVNDVAANFKTAAAESLKKVTELGKGLFENAIKSVTEVSDSFSPVEVVDTKRLKDEWETIVKEFFPSPLKAPAKDNTPVSGKGMSEGVGAIGTPGKGTKANILADSLQSIGGGGRVFGWMGMNKDPQEQTAEHTKKTAENTAKLVEMKGKTAPAIGAEGGPSTTPKLETNTAGATTAVIGPDIVAAQNKSSEILTDIRALLKIISTRNIVVKTSPLTVATV